MRHVAVTVSPLDIAAAHARVADPRAGASVVFTGHVRDHSPGKDGVTHLEYEAYTDHVEGAIGDVVAEADSRWDLCAVSVDHRVGVARLGEATVVVAVSAPHRADAFEAARYLIDELKARAPIWKKEHWPGGAEWSKGS